MKTLVLPKHPPVYITTPSPWNPRTPTLHHRKWKVLSEAKGFNRPQSSSQERKNAPVETIRRNASDDDDEKIPEVVFERMIARILFYVGAPMATGIAFLQVFGVLKEQNLWDVPIWLPFLTTFVTFGASALGIAYGTLSTSWDPKRKGSLLGFEEAQKNWVDMWREEEDS
ncbi:uncharacterized protein PAM68-like [Actinidia eriantha]|uniref:uncharacterized protein PAM68-like n=1 Tax=Actinidia eriantha TaxID=165200 RepID=UPI00258C86D3|nr:uncharacterized protein PAM68-like [Actinidia eriantha]